MYRQGQFSVQDLSGEILFSRKISRQEEYRLRTALLQQSLSEDDRILIDRVFYGIRKGLLKVVD